MDILSQHGGLMAIAHHFLWLPMCWLTIVAIYQAYRLWQSSASEYLYRNPNLGSTEEDGPFLNEDPEVKLPGQGESRENEKISYKLSTSPFHIAKFLILGLLIFATAVAILRFINHETPQNNTRITLICQLIQFLLCLLLHLLIFYEYNHPSSQLCMFWLLEMTSSAIELYLYPTTKVHVYVTMVCSFLIFVLENFPKSTDGTVRVSIEDPERQELMGKQSESTSPSINTAKNSYESQASFISRLSFSWLTNLLSKSAKTTLTQNDLYDLPLGDQANQIAAQFNKAWRLSAGHQNSTPIQLFWALFRSFGASFVVAAFLKIGHDCLNLLQPMLLKGLIDSVALSQKHAIVAITKEVFFSGSEPQELTSYRPYAFAFAMFTAALIQTVFLQQYFYRCFLTGMRLRCALVSAIYQKALRLSNKARQESSVGEIVNFMSVDAQRIMDVCGYFHILWSGPFQIVMAIAILYRTLGLSVFAGVAMMVLAMPLNGYLSSWNRKLEKILMQKKDERIKLMNDLLNGIKVVKLYAWEAPFLKKILTIRNDEVAVLRKLGTLGSITTFLWICTPMMVSVATFACYVLLAGGTLTSSNAFVALSLFNVLQMPMSALPNMITSVIEATIALQRIHRFLSSSELQTDSVDRTLKDGNTMACLEKASFSWNTNGNCQTLPRKSNENLQQDDQPFVLQDINFTIERGSLVSILGQVGSGKSSLMCALLGELTKLHGNVNLQGRIAYIPQQAWILNDSLRENILFGRQFDENRYWSVIEACALVSDLEALPAGDLTEIGEKGINLSGGQKQRVSLARALYADADVYFLDDPLSAVDAHVGRHLFDRVINGLLKEKTRIFVTNQLQYLEYSDYIIIMKQGKIFEQGRYDELMSSTSKGELLSWVTQFLKKSPSMAIIEDEEDEFSTNKDTLKSDSAMVNEPPTFRPPNRLVAAEETTYGRVKSQTYRAYFHAMGIFPICILLLACLSSQGTSLASNVWLATWSSMENLEKSSVGYYLGVYALLAAMQSLLVVLQAYLLYVVCGVRSALHLHKEMLIRLLRAPMSFFDTTPIGRILNRFSKDVYTIDEVLPRAFQSYLRMLFLVLSILGVIGWSTPWFSLAILPLAFAYHRIYVFYLASSRELKRLDSTTRSPIYAHFSETLQGATTIRAYCHQRRFIAENAKRLDGNQKPYYLAIAANRWLAMRLEVMGAIVILLAALFSVAKRHSLSPGTVGLSLTHALSLTQSLNWLVRQSCEIESHIIAVERVQEYCHIANEAPDITDKRVPENWPTEGTVVFDNYSARYRPDTPLVLKDISFSVKPHEKIGVCGRTGAGKSSLTLALLRIIESDEGRILIDGEIIGELGLLDIRQHLTIIPQDPVMFSGTVRDNLDPFDQYTDEAIWQALGHAHLSAYIMSLPSKLGAKVSANGENMSVGQRQLLSLARALLKKKNLLILDEATASVDVETDSLVQRTIREQFCNATVITIAHRLHSIMDSDRILVLEKGRVVEFDTPQALLERSDSIFHDMAREAHLI